MYQPLKSTREALARATGDRVVRTVCQSCHAECGVLARVREGRLVKVEGDPEHPFNKGKACVKGLSIAHMLYHPARLRYPLRRVGERGEGKWQRISWEEALEIASEGLLRVRERHGPESIIASAGTQPRGNFVTTIRLGQALGTPNFFCPTHVCFLPAIAAGKITIGGEIMQETGPDYLNSRLIVIWGANPVISHPPRGRDVLEAVMDRGARLIVIDPRMTELAARADLWLQVRPGADDALVLSWLNVIINEGLYDEAFVERWCKGFPELRERVQEYTPERVAEITWVPADLIRQAARMYATVKPAAFHKRVAVEQHTNAFQTLRAMISLIAITGNIDVKGGNRFPQYPEGFISRNAIAFDPSRLLPPEVLARRLGAEKFPFLLEPEVGWIVAHTPSGVEAMVSGRPYPIKGLIAFNNIALNFENSRAVWEGLKKLDFSLVSEFFMTPTAEMADLVLPAAMWPEKSEVCFAYYPNFITARVKAVEPQGECWDDKLMGMRLVRKMGVDPEGFYFPWNSVEEYNDYQVRGMGMSFSEFAERGYIVQERGERKYEASGFATPSGKVELKSELMARHGLDPLPFYSENPETPVSSPELFSSYPLIAISGSRPWAYYFSEMRQVETLRALEPDPYVDIHPETAEALGISDNDWVLIETPRMPGSLRQRARLTRSLHPKVVHLASHWWFPEKDGPEHGCFDSNPNAIFTHEGPYDPACGATPMRGFLVRIKKADED